MENNYNPILLTDNSRLQEIYYLRVQAYENSSYAKMVNSQIFPNGWFDKVDYRSFHWYITNTADKILASARLTYFDNFQQLGEIGIDINNLELDIPKPFALISRLVIDNSLRGYGISKYFDQVRLNKIQNDGVYSCLAVAREERVKSLLNHKFQVAGNIDFKANDRGVKEKLFLMIWINQK